MYEKLVNYAAKQLELDPSEITPDSTFESLGIDWDVSDFAKHKSHLLTLNILMLSISLEAVILMWQVKHCQSVN